MLKKSGGQRRKGLMKAVTWQGREDVRVEEVPDPRIEQPTDAVIRVTSTGLCGSDLHLYKVLGTFIDPGDILGHEPMGVVEEVGAEVDQIEKGDRVVIPFNISCGHCWMCERQLFAQCETTQNRDTGTGASLFGYTKLYGQVPGGQAEYLRVPQAQFGPIKVPGGAARRSLSLPLRRPADGLAGGRVRRHPRGRLGRDLRSRADRPDVGADRQAQGRARDRRRPRPGAAGDGARPGGRDARRLRRRRGHGRDRRADPRADRWPRHRLGDRRGRDGGPRCAVRRARPEGCRLPARCGRPAADREGGHRPAERAARLLRERSSRRHGLDQRRLRRRGRPDADDAAVRQGDSDPHGPGAREALDRRHPAAGQRRRRSARDRGLRHPPAAADRGARRPTRSSRRSRTGCSRSSSSRERAGLFWSLVLDRDRPGHRPSPAGGERRRCVWA